MAVAAGKFAVPGSTGNVTVTGLSFQPIAVIFVSSHTDLTSPAHFTVGAATADDEQWSLTTVAYTQSSGYTLRQAWLLDDRCTACVGRWGAEFVSFNSDGFTINFFYRAQNGNDVSWIALGGDHINAARAGTFTTGGSTGTASVTDPGFKPTGLIVGHTLTPDVATDDADFQAGVGVGDKSLNQYSWWVRGNSGTNGQTQHIHRTDEIACAYDGSNTFRMALDSMDATGFTVDVTDAWAADLVFGYLAIDGDGIVAGSDTIPDSTGTQQLMTPGLEPAGVFATYSGIDAPSTTGATNVYLRPGAGVMTTSFRHAHGCVFRTATSSGVFTADSYNRPVDELITIGGTGTGIGGADNDELARADFSAFAMGSFTIDWEIATAGADRAFGWLAFPGEVAAPWIPKLYRVGPR